MLLGHPLASLISGVSARRTRRQNGTNTLHQPHVFSDQPSAISKARCEAPFFGIQVPKFVCQSPMDPLSITAGVIAVLQAAEAVISVCCDYRSAIKGSSWEVPRVLEEVRALRNVLRTLEELADKAETPSSDSKSRLPALKLLCGPDTGILTKCRTELNDLAKKLTPPEWIGPAGSKRKGLVQALSWPLKKGETEKVLASIERFKSTINVAVATDQTYVFVFFCDDLSSLAVSCFSKIIFLSEHRY